MGVTAQDRRAAWMAHADADAQDFVEGYLLAPPPVPTGVAALDDALGGGLPSDGFTIVGGEGGAGKTALGIMLTYHAAMERRMPTYVSVEMTRQQCMMRLVSLHSALEPTLTPVSWGSPRIVLGQMMGRDALERMDKADEDVRYELAMRYQTEHGDVDPIMCAYRSFDRYRYYMSVRDSVTTLSGIDRMVRELAEVGIHGPVVIDYAQLLEVDGMSEEYDRMTRVSHVVQRLAKECRVPVMLISSLKKLTKQERDAGPTLDWFRGSGHLGYDATCAIVITRGAREGGAAGLVPVRYHIVKNRNGRADESIPLTLDAAHNRIY